MWADKTFRDWASKIDPGSYMVGELKEGNEVQFISSESGYGVTSKVTKLIPNEFVALRQMLDTKEHGKRERGKEWAGGEETYSIAERGGVTTLTTIVDVPDGQKETFKVRVPQALERLRTLAEK